MHARGSRSRGGAERVAAGAGGLAGMLCEQQEPAEVESEIDVQPDEQAHMDAEA